MRAPTVISTPLLILLFPAFVGAQTPRSPAATPPAATGFTLGLRDTTRAEVWRYFEPEPGGGDPNSVFVANRLQLELSRTWRKVDLQVTAQHVGFAGLPRTASGPGPLGLGSLYFDQGGRSTHPQQLWLRYGNVRLKQLLPGLDLTVGRMAYASGAEAASGDPRIEALKRTRLDARLVGEFEWSVYQRGFDGVRADFARGPVTVTGIAVRPTQGGFARVAGPTIDRIGVAGATVSVQPNRRLRHTQVQGFAIRYDDTRLVSQRPDNTVRTADRAALDITSVGGALVGAYPLAGGVADAVAWGVVQRGSWYEQDHRAGALALEAGYQWPAAAWAPWVRVGTLRTSGDRSSSDAEHGTYFPVLPTVRRFSQTTVVSTMNLHDTFVQLQLRPGRRLGLRLELHDLQLASAADRWYLGSGATLEEGTSFGYAGRRSNGARTLGISIEASADVAVTPTWSVNVFVGQVRAGRVVTGTFRGDRLWFGYVEQVLRVPDLRKIW